MKKLWIVFFIVPGLLALYSQDSGDTSDFEFTRAPSTAILEVVPGRSKGLDIDYMYNSIDSDLYEFKMNIFGVNYVGNRWNGNWGASTSFPLSVITADSDMFDEFTGLILAPTYSLAVKVLGDLDSTHLLGFGGATYNATVMTFSTSGSEMTLSILSLGAHAGAKGIIRINETLTAVPFAMVNATLFGTTNVNVSVAGYSSSSKETIPMSFAPVFGADFLVKDYSMGAVMDFSNDSGTTFAIHFRIPLKKTYEEDQGMEEEEEA